MKTRVTSRGMVRALGLLALLAGLACNSSGGMGLDMTANGPGWAPFSGGRMFGAPL